MKKRENVEIASSLSLFALPLSLSVSPPCAICAFFPSPGASPSSRRMQQRARAGIERGRRRTGGVIEKREPVECFSDSMAERVLLVVVGGVVFFFLSLSLLVLPLSFHSLFSLKKLRRPLPPSLSPRRPVLHPKMAFAQSMRASVQARPTSSRSRSGVRAVALVRRPREGENCARKLCEFASRFSFAAGHQKKKTRRRFLRSPDSSRCLGSRCFSLPLPPG